MKERRKHLILVGCILAALVGVAFLAVPGSPVHRKPTLGLDLQGGLEVVLKAVPPKGHKLTSDDLSRSIDIMRKRIDKLGVSEPEIRKQGSNQIVIQLAGIHDPAAAAKVIGKTAVLEFYDFEADLTGPSVSGLAQVPIAKGSLYDLLIAPETQALADKGVSQWYLFDAKHDREGRAGTDEGRAAAEPDRPEAHGRRAVSASTFRRTGRSCAFRRTRSSSAATWRAGTVSAASSSRRRGASTF